MKKPHFYFLLFLLIISIISFININYAYYIMEGLTSILLVFLAAFSVKYVNKFFTAGIIMFLVENTLEIINEFKPFNIFFWQNILIIYGTVFLMFGLYKFYKKYFELEKTFNGIFKRSNEAIFFWGKDKKLIKANPRAAKLLGYNSPEEMVGMEVEKHVFKEDYEHVNKIKKLLDNKEEIEPYERKYKTLNGEIKWVEVHAINVQEGNGEYYFQEIDHEITDRKKLEEQLYREKEKFRMYFEYAQVMYVILDKNGNIEDLNLKACEILKVKKEEVIGENWFENFIPENIRDEVKEVFNKIMSGELESVEYFENEIITKDGEILNISWHNTYLLDENGNIDKTFSSGLDITAEKKYLETLKYNAKFATKFLNLNNEILTKPWNESMYQLILDTVIDIIPSAEAGSLLTIEENQRIFTYKAVQGYNFEKLKEIKYPELPLSIKKPIIIDDWDDIYIPPKYEYELLIKYGRLKEIKQSLIIPFYLRGKLYGLLTLDIFDEKKKFSDIDLNFANIIKSNLEYLILKVFLELQLKKSAELDYLTGIYNRQAFFSRVKMMMSYLSRHNSSRMGLLYIDIDKFKHINDTYGHKVGDEVLKFFVKQVSSMIRESDLFGRIGGDEFTVALMDTDKEGIESFISRMKKVFKEKPFIFEDIKINISSSIGYSIYPDEGKNIDILLDIADKRMYINKRKKPEE
ncbi:sensor domain-containing diguanylate cyclase [Marinitoga sp. 1138]|uniref:sensor domain-containing diguanylate cyclase n=1 Tax=Marinitoga sp. 1138 TaxID=1643334 RepID=UPI001586F3ED|nr:sensor domain-containing diguanylate cyclase [Marinitoga sp. 1138]NUU98263.1 hypothetical protein [Marinitoga sp. 1138]